jgi:hypothetical protein
VGTITLDVAHYGHECDTCQQANYRRPGSEGPRYPCLIYTLTIGAGYRLPAYLCPNCLDILRLTLGVKSRRMVRDIAERNRPAFQLIKEEGD